jgi:hypothetical protein
MRLWKINMKDWPYFVGTFICTVIKGLQLPVYAYAFGQFIQVSNVEVVPQNGVS